MNTYHYTYLITNLQPVTEKYYIGIRSCNCLPNYDISYMGSSRYLKEEMDHFGHQTFEKIIIKIWPTRAQAMEHEIYLHSEYDVRNNKIFYNKANQKSIGFDYDPTGNKESSITRKRKSISVRKVLNSKVYKEGKGKIANKNHSITKSNPAWKEKIGKNQVKNRLKTISTAIWKEKHTFVCPHCKKSIQNKANLNRWHNDNCKSIR